MYLTSASGIISLLEEPTAEPKIFALKKLNAIVDEFWPEISEAIKEIEILHEDKTFKEQKLAALVASKVYYHLGSFDDSLKYALRAGNLFDVSDSTEYVETIITKIIDLYTKVSHTTIKLESKTKGIRRQLTGFVNRMFKICFANGHYRQALGLAMETQRIDIFETAIVESGEMNTMLAYGYQLVTHFMHNCTFRNNILHLLVRLYEKVAEPNYINMCQCFISLNDPCAVAQLLRNLQQSTEEHALMSYQIAFDVYECTTQYFLRRIIQELSVSPDMSVFDKNSTIFRNDLPAPSTLMPSVSPISTSNSQSTTEEKKKHEERTKNIISILSGEVTVQLYLQFLSRNNNSDMFILSQTKEHARASICHNATVIANAFMQTGTTSDEFLCDNLKWLAQVANWGKVTTIGSLGLIHRGREEESVTLLQSYLPEEEHFKSDFVDAGYLYALGLIHANHGEKIIPYLQQQLKEASNSMARHGGCLGLGLAALGTHCQDVYQQLKSNLHQDDAITGQAAGIAMGMVMLGSKSSEAIEDMITYAEETDHEKIASGLAVGVALIMYGRLEEAESVIATLYHHSDPLLRRCAMYTLALAYCGTGDNNALRRLLHTAVADADDDVRRAAVLGIGFLLCTAPHQCIAVVALLAESYNPHVRYGAAMALGIACAAIGLQEAVALLEPLTDDPVNFVRQGAFIASAMILIQHTEYTCPKVKDFRSLYAGVIADKYEDPIAKFGAILSQGIIDAGGRNVTLSLQSRAGHLNPLSVVGVLLFMQYWYWFPLALCLGLAFTPTCIIALNGQLKMPQLQFRCNAPLSLFTYPSPIKKKKTEEEAEEERNVFPAPVLSSASKLCTRRRSWKERKQCFTDIAKANENINDVKEIHHQNESEKSNKITSKNEIEETNAKLVEKQRLHRNKYDTKTENVSEILKHIFCILNNPSRCLKQQLKFLQVVDDSKYVPLKEVSRGGIIIVRMNAGAKEIELESCFGPHLEEEEPQPPEPFEYIED
ncbi:hypothetical protein R5R35_004963 [Gryllus longicercus]|uniref:26S proteasome non-ATPase regulatory subunit 1 n=1 Tax=Gryllus longicercus TaxID=2509291 RepID=A0AAN9VWS7_9ORTH